MEGVSGRNLEGGREIDSSRESYQKAKQDDLCVWTGGCGARGEEGRSFKRLC